MSEFKVLLADDHGLVRDTIAAFLEHAGGFVVHPVPDLPSALDRLQKQGPFDLVLLDYTMAGMNGIAGLRRTIEENTGVPIALISGTATQKVAQEALMVGARGFVSKTLPAEAMVHAVRLMASGEKYLPGNFMDDTGEEPPPNPIAAKLTTREHQVLKGLCSGLSNKEIARLYDVQEVTVKVHVKTLCRKLEARNRTHAAMIGKESEIC